MKQENTNSLLVTKLVEGLLQSRKNGRFGATQATCMALKALIKYAEVQNKKLQSNEQFITVNVNGTKQSQKIKYDGSGKFIVNGLEEFLVKGVNDISVQFKDQKNTFPYEVAINWKSSTSGTSLQCPINLTTSFLCLLKN